MILTDFSCWGIALTSCSIYFISCPVQVGSEFSTLVGPMYMLHKAISDPSPALLKELNLLPITEKSPCGPDSHGDPYSHSKAAGPPSCYLDPLGLVWKSPNDILNSSVSKLIYSDRQVKALSDFITFKSCLLNNCQISSLDSNKFLGAPRRERHGVCGVSSPPLATFPFPMSLTL